MMASVPFKGIELDMKLGIPPGIGVGFVTTAPAEKAATALSGAVQV
jgi:hypothetical protein